MNDTDKPCKYYHPGGEGEYYEEDYCELDDEMNPICFNCKAKNIDDFNLAQFIKEKKAE